MQSRTLKEIARHVLHTLSIDRLYYRLSGNPRDFVGDADLASKFSTIYSSGHWQNGDRTVPLSGQGSSLNATVTLRSELPKLLREIRTRTLLDVGCGDFTWMSESDLSGMNYIGADIVPSVITQNKERYESDHRAFVLANAATEDLPPADVILCREVLFHLSFADAKAVLRNMLKTGASHFLLTMDYGTKFNADIHSGDFRLLNLQLRPFSLPEPRHKIQELIAGRYLGLWLREDVLRAVT